MQTDISFDVSTCGAPCSISNTQQGYPQGHAQREGNSGKTCPDIASMESAVALCARNRIGASVETYQGNQKSISL